MLDYYTHDVDDLTQPYISPLLAPDLSGLPPTFVTTAAFDRLRDEGRMYAERLSAAGVEVTHVEYYGTHTVAQPVVVEQRASDLVEAISRFCDE